MPADRHEGEVWEKKYHWHEMHHQEFPMIPQPYITSTCAKCHVDETRIRGADTWNRGRQLVENYGCFGCHKMKGMENERKVGPNLSRIASKTTREFLYKWIRKPRDFRDSTRMPRFFNLDNTEEREDDTEVGTEDDTEVGTEDDTEDDTYGTIKTIGIDGTLTTHDFKLRNGVEALSIAAYIDNSSLPRTDELFKLDDGLVANPDDTDQVQRGREVFKGIGCTGCHSIDSEQISSDDGQTAPDERFNLSDHAPDLSSIGSKLDPAFLLDWIVNPKKYFPKTRMPRLRIEEVENGQQKLADLVAFLMTKKNETFDELEMFRIDKEKREILGDLVYDFARRKTTRQAARDMVAGFYAGKTDPNERTAAEEAAGDEAALNYVGEKFIQRYGCFGCHEGIQNSDEDIENFDDAQPIGADLTKHGVKNVYRLEFAHWGHQPDGKVAIPHNRIAWFTKKLENPRIFDMLPVYRDTEGIYEPSKKRMEKSPEELLKMPRFSFYENLDEVRSVVTFLISQLPDPIPPRKQRLLDKDEKTVEDGLALVRFLNCAGCHRLGAGVQEVPIDELPRFSYLDPPENKAINDLERETWLAEALTVKEYKDPEGRFTLPEITFPKNTFLGQKFLYTIWNEDDKEFVEDAYSVVEIADFYWELTGRPESQRILGVYGYREGQVIKSISLAPDDRVLSPPLLRREGERVNGQWLFEFLLKVHKIRESTEIRMPTFDFTPQQSRTMAEMFRILADVDGPHEVFEDDELNLDMAREGAQMFKSPSPADQGVQPPPIRHNCDNCHPVNGKRPSNADQKKWGPELNMARKRLRPSWIRGWLADPKTFLPGTPMPTFFFQSSVFPDDADKADRLPEAERELLDRWIPFVEREFFKALDGRQNWKHELDQLMQYLVHIDVIEGK